MKTLIIALAMSVTFSQMVIAQKKKPAANKKENKEMSTPSASAVVSSPNPADSLRTLTASEILSQHYANKYSLAVQWNDSEVAKSALYDLIVENPRNDSIIFDLAFYYYKSNQFPSAALVSDVLIKNNPKNMPLLEISAISLENIGAYDKALERYETLYLLKDEPVVLYKMAFLQRLLKRYTESLANIENLLSSPKVDSTKLPYTVGNNERKEVSLRVALYNLKGLVLKDKNDKAGAKKIFEQALALDADFHMSKENIASLDKPDGDDATTKSK